MSLFIRLWGLSLLHYMMWEDPTLSWVSSFPIWGSWIVYNGESELSNGHLSSVNAFSFSRQGFSVTLEPVLELALVDQDGLELTEIHLPLPPQCWD